MIFSEGSMKASPVSQFDKTFEVNKLDKRVAAGTYMLVIIDVMTPTPLPMKTIFFADNLSIHLESIIPNAPVDFP